MKEHNSTTWKKLALVGAGLLLAVAMSAPYIAYREQIQQYATVGYAGVVIACAISNATVLIPSSSTMIVLAAASTLNPITCIVLGGLGAAVGEQVSYVCGRIGRGAIKQSDEDGKLATLIGSHGFLTVFLFAFLPLPVFDLAGIAAGMAKMQWGKYIAAAFLGKTLKFLLAIFAAHFLLPIYFSQEQGVGFHVLQSFLEEIGRLN